MWSNLKTLLDRSCLGNEQWASRVWLIVPFDRSAVATLWGTKNRAHGSNGHLADTFISKTFQVTFHVPPPVLTNWADYFKRALKCALPDFQDNDEIHAVYRVFRLKKFSGPTSPTPRDIKIFVNRIGALYRQWHQDVPLRLLALYAAIEGTEDLVRQMQSEDMALRHPLAESFVGREYVLRLAAVHFGVPPEQSAQVLLGAHIEKCISERDADAVMELRSQVGFSEVLEEIVEQNGQDWAKEQPATIGWLAEALDSESIIQTSEERTWEHLCKSARSVKTWKSIDESIGRGLAKLLMHEPTAEFAGLILDSLSETDPFPEVEGLAVPKHEMDKWLRSCLLVVNAVAAGHGDELLKERFRCPSEGKHYITIIEWALTAGYPRAFVLRLVPATDAQSVIRALMEFVVAGTHTDLLDRVAKCLSEMDMEWPWKGLVDAIVGRLRAPTIIGADELAALLGTLLHLGSKSREAESAQVALSKSGDIFHHLHTTHTNKHAEGTALCLYMELKHNISGTIPQHVGNSAIGVQIFGGFKGVAANFEYALDDLLQITIGDGSIGLVLDMLGQDKASGTLQLRLIERLARREDLLAIVSVDALLKHESVFYTALNDNEGTYEDVITRYVDHGGLMDVLVNSSFDSGLASLYTAALLSDHSDNRGFQSWLSNGVGEVTEDRWIAELEHSYGNLFDLLVALRGKDTSIALGVGFRNALVRHRDLVADGTIPKANLKDDWSTMLDCLEEDYQKAFTDQTLERIVESTKPQSSVIELFGQRLMDQERLELAIDDLLHKGFPKFVAEQRLDELNWLKSILVKYPNIVKKARKEYRKTFLAEVENLLEKKDLSEEVKTALSNVANALGISPRSKAED